MRFGKGTTKNGAVLGKDKDLAAIDQAMARYHAVTGIYLLVHPKILRTMFDQLIELLKGCVVEQELNPLARSHLAVGVLLLDARGAAAGFGALLTLAQLIEFGRFRGLLFL